MRTRIGRHPRVDRQKRHLQVESLEDRSVPSTIGAFDSQTATWYLRNRNSSGTPNAGVFQYGAVGWRGVTGDWNGDRIDTAGVVNPANPAGLTWYLRNTNSAGAPDIAPFVYGAQSWFPVAGDWDGNGTTTVGAYDPLNATWYLRNSNSAGGASIAAFSFGAPGWTPVVGDWDGNGTTTVGVVDPLSGTWYLRNTNSAGGASITPFRFGAPGWTPVSGDWDGDGKSGVGSVSPGALWFLRNSTTAGGADISPFAYGAGDWQPVTGDWFAFTTALAPMPQPDAIASILDFATGTQETDDEAANLGIRTAITDILPPPPL